MKTGRRDIFRVLGRTLAASVRRRPRAACGLVGWSLLETAPTLVLGQAVAHGVDAFRAGHVGLGLAWLALLAATAPVGAYGTKKVFGHLAAIVEPFRDDLVRWVVRGTLHRSLEGRPDSGGVARLTHQTEIVRDTLAGVLMVARGFAFTAVGTLIGLLSLMPLLLALVVPPLLLAVVLFGMVIAAAATRQRELIVGEERIAAECTAMAEGLRDIVACGGEAQLAAALERRLEAQVSAGLAVARMSGVRALTVALGGWLPLLLILAAAPWLMDRGATAGTVIAALTYVMRSLHPALSRLVTVVGGNGLRLAVTMMRIVETGAPPRRHGRAGAPAGATGESPAAGREQGHRPGSHRGGSEGSARACFGPERFGGTCSGTECSGRVSSGRACPGARAGDTAGAVELRGVTFRYGPHAEPVIADLRLFVPRGDHLAIVGPSGIGKSTLAAVIAGLLRPDAGEVTVYGRAPGDPADRVFLPQDPYVFGGTLRENLAYLAPQARDGHLRAAIAALGLERLVHHLGGLEAEIDPGALSGGERQQIALARAYLTPAPLVVLDEATCELDATAEARAETAFARRPGTLIVIAHRMTSALRARRILVLDGTTARLGRHEDLLTRSRLYRDLVGHWRSQPSALLRDADRVHPVPRTDLVVDPGQVVAHRPDG